MAADEQLPPDILGTLVCVIIRARNLPDKTVIGKQSPYATVTFGNHKKRTKTIPRGGQQPTWDEEFRFEIPKDINAVGPGSAMSTNKHGGVGSGVESPSSTKGKGKGKFEIRDTSVVLPQHKGKRLLRLAVYADDHKDPHLIGDALLELEETIKKGSFDDWVPLELKNRSAGEIYLELTWYHNGPRPRAKTSKTPASSAASTYGGAGLRVAEPDPAPISQQAEPVDDWDRDGPSSVGGYPHRPLSQSTFHTYNGPPLELSADYPDPDVGPLASSLAGLSVRPALPQPPAHSQLSHSTSYYDSPVSPVSATSTYSRPLPDPRVASGSITGPAYDHRAQQQQWRHSSPYLAQQGQASIDGYPAGPSNGHAYGQPPVSEFGAAPYVPAVASYQQPAGVDDRAQWQAGHHASYSDVGHQADYGAPPTPIGEFEQLANQHRYSTGTPLPPPGAYGAPPPAAYHQPPSLLQPPQPPLPPPTPLEYERQVHGASVPLPLPPQPPAHLLGRSQSVASSMAGGYPSQQVAPAGYAPPAAQSPYNAPPPPQSPYNAPPPPAQSPYNAPPPQHAYSSAPPPQPTTYNPYATAPAQPPAAPPRAPSPAGYGSVNGHGYGASGDYGPPPAAPVHVNGGYREPSPVPPPPPQAPQGQGNYLRQQYDLNVAQQQQSLAQSQGYGQPPAPPPRPASGYGAPQGAYNPYGYQ